MKVTISRGYAQGLTYLVNFSHDPFYLATRDEEGAYLEGRIRGKTECTIIREGDSGRPHKAKALCSNKDQYNKEIGRRISLTRALSLTRFNKDQRRDFWQAYLQRK